MQIPLSTGNPIVRPLATFVLLALAVYSLLAHWEHHGGGHPSFGPMGNLDIHVLPGYGGKPSHTKPTTPPPYNGTGRAVVAHFMVSRLWHFWLTAAGEYLSLYGRGLGSHLGFSRGYRSRRARIKPWTGTMAAETSTGGLQSSRRANHQPHHRTKTSAAVLESGHERPPLLHSV